MNIVILNGSPRKQGNTKAVIEALTQGINPNQHNIEVINTNALNISGCLACNYCKNGDHQCIHKDDTNPVIEKIVQGDLLIFATPVYWWGISAQLKLVVDKFYAKQPQLKDKKYGIIAIGGAGVENVQYELISKQFKAIGNFLSWTNVLDESQSAYEVDDLRDNKAIMAKYKTIGESL